MSKPVSIRYIPKWLSGAMTHYGTDIKEFESIVSRHDVDLYKLANHLFRARLNSMGLDEFLFPDADAGKGFSSDDAVFALFGGNPQQLAIPQFVLGYFDIYPDKYDGIIIVEREGGEVKDVMKELLKAVALYRGVDVAYASVVFRRYLEKVNKDLEPGSSHAVELTRELTNNDQRE